MSPAEFRRATVLAIVLAVASTPLGLAEEFDRAPDRTATSSSGDAFRPLGPNLFPFYQHYERTQDATEVLNLFYLYHATWSPRDEGWSQLLVPFFYRDHRNSPWEDTFFLFPLLYFGKSSEEDSYDYWLPFYYSQDSRETSFRYLFPFWMETKGEGRSREHVIPPLFRHTVDESVAEEPVESSRLGLWRILELWESRSSAKESTKAAFTFFNWSGDAESGLSLFRARREDRDGEERGYSYLFPFYWEGRRPGSEYLWFVPFWGRSSSTGDVDHYLPFALSRVGWGVDEERRVDVLYPLLHLKSDPKSLFVYSFPLFHSWSGPDDASWSALLLLYRTHLTRATGKRTHSFLFPLSYFDVEPDGVKGTRWFFPYVETFNEARLWRFVFPFWYEYQTLAGGETDWFFRLGLPVYLSLGYEKDNFSMGFPLYWSMEDGSRGWDVFFPIYWGFRSASAWETHVIPFVSYRSLPSRRETYVLGPLYIQESFFDSRRNPTGSGHHILWPFLGWEDRKDGYLWRFLPFVSASRTADASDLLLTPFYYQSDGPAGKHRYFLPVYGRYRSRNLDRDLYALGSYIRTEERNEAGETVRNRSDVLWSLLSWEEDLKSRVSHQHFLPLGIWNTDGPLDSRTVAGPFYYGHEIVSGDETHHLDLVLGNLYFSKVVEGPVATETERAEDPPPVAVAETQAPPPAATAAPTPEGGSPLYPLADPSEKRGVISSDRGILWPLTRSYSDSSGKSTDWVIPFYFDFRDRQSETLALWPFAFLDAQDGPYEPSFARYLFLFDRETWRGGYRISLGQILFDWKTEETVDKHRLRLLYPLLQHAWDSEGYDLDLLDPFCTFSDHEGVVENRIFPFYWQGSTTRKTEAGEPRIERSHFFLFPLWGEETKPDREDYYVLFPFFHLATSLDALRFELWPSVFWRDDPSLLALRLWPLHADETGVDAGDFWGSRYFFFSKRFETEDSLRYRLDPFLFRLSDGPGEAWGFGSLFECIAYDREGPDRTSFRGIPLVWGGSTPEESWFSAIPFYYEKDSREAPIDYLVPWRFLFLSHHLEGNDGERHTGVLWKLFDYTHNTRRPEYFETSFLYRLFFLRETETSQNLEFNPLVSYYRDEVADETLWGFLLSLYQVKTQAGRTTHTLFYFLDF